MAKKKKKKWYAIKSLDGKVVNEIVTTWDACKKKVDHHRAVYKSFVSEDEAKNYLNNMSVGQAMEAEKRVEYRKAEAKKRRATTKAIHCRVPNSVADKFEKKLKIMGYSPDDVVADLIKEWCSEDE
jgi:viroplasmin and RNaseH domain-containing protein